MESRSRHASPTEKEAIAAREKAKAKELENIARARQQKLLEEERLRETLHQKCTNFRLLARWTFQSRPEAGRIQDQTGAFAAELLGARVVDLPEGNALQFQADKEAVRLPEEVLDNRACGVIMFWFRRDDAE